MTDTPRRPETRRLDTAPAQPRAPVRPDTRPADAGVPIDTPDATGTSALDRDAAPAPNRTALWPRIVGLGAGLLLVAGVGAAVERAVTAAVTPGHWSGWLIAGGAGLVAIGLAIACGHELRGLRDLRRLDGLNARAYRVRDERVADDPSLIRGLTGIYAGRGDLDGQLRAFRRDAEGIGDSSNQLAAFEMHVLAGLDDRAHAAIARAVRRNATATALSPFALLDASVTAWTSLRMIREIALLFGARPGITASVRLARIAFANVLAAGVFETAQDALNDLVSGGIAGRVSTSMASAVANGLLTARLGLAAIDACRPVPVARDNRPGARSLVRQALSDVIAGRRTDREPAREE